MKTFAKVMAVIGILAIIVFAKGIGKMVGKTTFDSYNQGKIETAVEQTLLETSKQINTQLPIMVDKETRFDTTLCAGKDLYVKYTLINISENDIDKEAFVNEVKSTIVKNQCGNAETAKMLRLGVQYYYMYQDRDGILLGTINVSKNDCGF